MRILFAAVLTMAAALTGCGSASDTPEAPFRLS